MVSYIFGGDTNLTPEDIKRQRAITAALAESRTPQNTGEGVGALMKGIAGALVNARANSAETAGRKSAMDAFSPILQALRDPSPTDSNVTTTTPDFSPEATADPKKVAPSSIMDKSLPPVEGTIANARTNDRNSVQNYAGMDLKSGIKASADALGIKPEDLATAISYETAGTFDPLKKGPTTKWGQHRGLIQFGEPQAKENGVDWNDPLNSQLGPEGAVVKYLRAAGVKPGMELIDIYSAINAGGVNRHNASDAKNGGAWGTVADKVKYQMDGHRKKALALFADPEAPATAFDAQPNLNKPVEVASLDGNIPVAEVPDGFQQPDPLQTQAKPVEVAQATLTDTPKRARNEPTDEVVIKALMNPWLDDTQKAVAKMYYEQRLNERDFQRKLEAERNDPKYKMDMEKGQIELENLRNPKKATNLTDEQERALGLPIDGVYQEKPDGSILTIREPSKPGDAISNEKAQIELNNLKNPPKASELSAEDKAKLGLPADGVYQRKADGSIVTVREPEKATADWSKLDDGSLFNQRTGVVKNVEGQTVGFRFPGNSPEAAALNGLIDTGKLTAEQAMNIAAGKQMTGPNGEIIFATPQALIGGQDQRPTQDGGIDIFAGQQPDPAKVTDPAQVVTEKPADAVPVMERPNSGMIPLTAPKVTVDQSKAAGFADRLNESGVILDQLENFAANKDTVYDQAKSSIPIVGNFLTSDDFKSLDQAKRNFINAQLRRESGAVISPTEFENANQQYFPQAGDPPEVIEQKRKGRKTAIEAMIRDAGPTYKMPKIEQPKKDAAKKADVDIGAPPEGVTAEEWKHMSEEDRALWRN